MQNPRFQHLRLIGDNSAAEPQQRMLPGLRVPLTAMLVALTAAPVLPAAAADARDANDAWRVSGDIRTGYVSSETRARSGTTSSSDSFRARVRLRLSGDLGSGWHVSSRAAARLDTDQEEGEFWLRPYAPSPAGLENGHGTLDEAYVEYRPIGAPWSLRLGRFQAAFGLGDIMGKSLDQNDSANFDVTWTDGAWLQWRAGDWATHVIVRHNDRRGPTGTLRQPLDFSDSNSHTGVFVATESSVAAGPLVQRMVTLTWLPSALRPFGGSGPAEDYLAATVKTAAQWPISGMRKFRLAAELGYAPNTPRRETMNSGTGEADALSWQTSISIIDILPDHSFGIIYGRVADGWLLSSDFRPNDNLAEARWVWRINPAWQIDARVRHRWEIDLPDTAARHRRDDDLYLRATLRF